MRNAGAECARAARPPSANTPSSDQSRARRVGQPVRIWGYNRCSVIAFARGASEVGRGFDQEDAPILGQAGGRVIVVEGGVQRRRAVHVVALELEKPKGVQIVPECECEIVLVR